MFFSPVKYNEPVFRPPAEANSSIIQATIGCSWNKCSFCEMYSSKSFRLRKLEEIHADIKALAAFNPNTRKIFLADGNAFVLKSNKLLEIISKIKLHYNRIQRISAYALPKDILSKTPSELIKLRHEGLKLLYIGIESGDDELLSYVNKGETYNTTLEGIKKAHEAGIDTSVMVLTGLGGRLYSRQHAINSAKIINLTNPKYLSTLTLSLPYGQPHFESKFKGEYIQQTENELAHELKVFIENLDVNNCIFRSDHVSNNIVLKGVLGKDKEMLLRQIEQQG